MASPSALHVAQWLSWNVAHDFWYEHAELDRVRHAIDAVDAATPGISAATPGLRGAELLVRCAAGLRHLRVMSTRERDLLPDVAINHVTGGQLLRKYSLAPGSEWALGSLPGELDPNLTPGTAIEVKPRGRCFFWLTFQAGGDAVPRDPDEVTRRLGLDWRPQFGTVVRITIPIDALLAAGALFVIPVLFDVIRDDPTWPLTPDWRARPESEHHTDEPWGHARDMQGGGRGLPEVIADITSSGAMSAEILGTMKQDWSTRPFLGARGPQ